VKILICGPESSGKTKLSKDLSRELAITMVPEFARSYLEKNGPKYEYEDLLKIAQTHHALVIKAQKRNEHLILDTHLLNLKIWSEHKYGKCESWIVEMIKHIEYDLILLCKPNLPWVADPLRESKGQRSKLFNKYEKELQSLGFSYFIIDAQGNNRFLQAFSVCNDLISNSSFLIPNP